MSLSIRRLGKLLAVGYLLTAPLAAHIAVVTERGGVFAGPLIALQVALVSWAALSLAATAAIRRHPARWLLIRLAVCLVSAGLTIALWRREGNEAMLAVAMPHAVAFFSLLMLFAISLATGDEPIITRVARRSRGALSDELVRYTRRVTIAWCCFFAAQLGASALLGLWAPPAWWSGFINLGTIPLVALMFSSELGYRHWRHGIQLPGGSVGRLRGIVQLVGQIRAPFRQAEL